MNEYSTQSHCRLADASSRPMWRDGGLRKEGTAMNNKDLRVHHFTLSVACEYGVNEAVILQNIYYWVEKNAANRRHFHDGATGPTTAPTPSPRYSPTTPRTRYSTRSRSSGSTASSSSATTTSKPSTGQSGTPSPTRRMSCLGRSTPLIELS